MDSSEEVKSSPGKDTNPDNSDSSSSKSSKSGEYQPQGTPPSPKRSTSRSSKSSVTSSDGEKVSPTKVEVTNLQGTKLDDAEEQNPAKQNSHESSQVVAEEVTPKGKPDSPRSSSGSSANETQNLDTAAGQSGSAGASKENATPEENAKPAESTGKITSTKEKDEQSDENTKQTDQGDTTTAEGGRKGSRSSTSSSDSETGDVGKSDKKSPPPTASDGGVKTENQSARPVSASNSTKELAKTDDDEKESDLVSFPPAVEENGEALPKPSDDKETPQRKTSSSGSDVKRVVEDRESQSGAPEPNTTPAQPVANDKGQVESQISEESPKSKESPRKSSSSSSSSESDVEKSKGVEGESEPKKTVEDEPGKDNTGDVRKAPNEEESPTSIESPRRSSSLSSSNQEKSKTSARSSPKLQQDVAGGPGKDDDGHENHNENKTTRSSESPRRSFSSSSSSESDEEGQKKSAKSGSDFGEAQQSDGDKTKSSSRKSSLKGPVVATKDKKKAAKKTHLSPTALSNLDLPPQKTLSFARLVKAVMKGKHLPEHLKVRHQARFAVGFMQKLKEEREGKRAQLDGRHEYIINAVAHSLGLESAEIEESMLEGTQIDRMAAFFAAGGKPHLMFFYQDFDAGMEQSIHLGGLGRPDKPISSRGKKPKLFITEGTDVALTGQCVFFLRNKVDKAVTTENIHREVTLHMMDTSDKGLLHAIEKMLVQIFIPALQQNQTAWGELAHAAGGKETEQEFITVLDSFVEALAAARDSLDEKITLEECTTFDLSKLVTPSDCAAVVSSTESLELVEECVRVWIKQIEKVLAESEQMRKEADNIGPRAELEHWKRRMSKFNYLLEQLKSQNVKAALSVLTFAKSKLLVTWRELDGRITNFANEAKDNVKYLYTLEKFCLPLYNRDPVAMIESLPGLINTIRMIHSISHYYNTSERMTSLFVKVTNQMVSSCKLYITDNDTMGIYEQEREEIISKLNQCIKLNEEYQRCFQNTKKMLENTPNERKFDFSEMYIFGKFDSFTRRLKKIITMFETIKVYAAIEESNMEGLETLASKYQVIVASMKKKQYNPLDQRKKDFDDDFEEFMNSINDLHNQLVTFMDEQFERAGSTGRAVKLLRKFEKLEIPNMNIDDKYHIVLINYGKEMENISRIYNKEKTDPVLQRNMPPISGKIMWARQLFRRIQQPMELLQVESPDILKTAEGKKVIRNFNKIGKVLLEYEVLYHRAWLRQVDLAKEGLQASLLVKHPETKKMYVNFDAMILTLIKETECMARLELEIPATAKKIGLKRDLLKKNSNELKHMLEEYTRIREKTPQEVEPLMEPHIGKVEAALEPGLTVLNWTSINIETFMENVWSALAELELFLDRICDLKKFRIEGVLQDIIKVSLVQFKNDESMTPQEFLKTTQELCVKNAHLLQAKSTLVEEAVNELIDMLLDFQVTQDVKEDPAVPGSASEGRSGQSSAKTRTPASARRRKRDIRAVMEEEASELFHILHQRNIEALVKVVRTTLESIRKRLSSSGGVHFPGDPIGPPPSKKEKSKKVGLLLVKAVLAIPNISYSPGLDQVQVIVNHAVESILSVMRGVSQWTKDRFRRVQGGPHGVTFGNLPRKMSSVSMSGESESSVSGSHARAADGLSPRPPKKDDHVPLPGLAVQSTNYHQMVSANKEVNKLVLMIGSSINTSKEELFTVLEHFKKYHHVWKTDKDDVLEEFRNKSSLVGEYEHEMLRYKALVDDINSEPQIISAGPVAVDTDDLKLALTTECQSWMTSFGRDCNAKYCVEMDTVLSFIDDVSKKLSRPVKDLDDIRILMSCLKEIRERQIDIDMIIGPIENSYNILTKFNIPVTKEELERVDLLRYTWEKLLVQATEVQNNLVDIQPNFRGELVDSIEVFQEELADFFESYTTSGPMVEGVQPQEASDRLIIYQNRFDTIWRKHNTYSGGEELFGLPVTPRPELHEVRKQLSLLQKLYGLYNNVITTVNGYYDILWAEIDIEKINDELLEFQNRCRKLPRALREWQAYLDLKAKIDDFSETCPLLELMSNKAMKQRHWDRIAKTTQCEFDFENEAFSLRNIMEAPLLENKEDIEDICVAAVKEKDIEAKLKAVMLEWEGHEFVFANFKNRGELLLRGDHTTEIVTALEDSLMVLSSLMSNRYNTPFRASIQKWVQNLTNTTEIIENWMTVQNLWVYLEAVFVGGDIAKQLPKEAKRFSNIDKSWVRIMTRAHETTNVVKCSVGDETLFQLLPHLLEQLELCQKSLTGYLEKKRLLFPRFFFVSDPVLLEILGQASNSHTIQAHLLNVFDNIKLVKFHEKLYDRILAIISREGETIDLISPVNAEGNVEVWLKLLLNKSKQSVHSVIKTAYLALQDTNFQLIEFLNTFPAQVGLLGLQMLWTRDSSDALANAKYDKKIMQTTNQGFLDLLNVLIEMTTMNLGGVERVKYETLITIHVHQRDIFDELVKKNVKSVSDFEWQKQSRFYFDEDRDKTIISITDVNFEYQNEFIGCTERLVITPLTDRCYITLAQALGMNMGGAPAGPAGTGKTETTKDMGKALGKYVVVFNCSDQMDFRGLGRIFKGLAQSGSWGCFDEFNRIELPVLSVAAQQISVVLSAKKERKKRFIFTDGDEVELSPEFGIFLTMNPGYAGRQELPENLKINFRNVAMMVPDRMIIIRVKLAAVGFKENIVLSRKFYILYKLCEEQLTKQVHYDFGLRNILSVLRTLGAAKRINPEDTEHKIVMRVLRDMNLSKLIDEDEPLFLSLINDLFPSITLDQAGYPDLEGAIRNRVTEAGLINHPPWTLKIVQLFETQRVRHGMMALGPSGAGKTCCIHTLMKAMTDCGQPHREMRMNPKAITAPQMFGRLDVATNDWTDGIFSTLWRRTLRAKKGEHIWLVLDGPVDTIWIENLNSVLDDNKTLTLANGDRIPMAVNCKVIFEPSNIDNASPATVSRNGMVYMSSSVLDWEPILEGWLLNRPESEATVLRQLFSNSFAPLYRYAIQNLDFKMDTLEAFIIRQALVLLDGLIPQHDKKANMTDVLKKLFVFAIMWSVGALLEIDDRRKMNEFLQEHSEFNLDLPTIRGDGESMIFDYLVGSDGKWSHWSEHVTEYIYPSDHTPDFHSILVPNVDNIRTDFLINTVAKQGKGVLLVGEQGTAKTVIVKGYLAKMNPEEHLSKNLNFSSATTPMLFQRTIESYVEKRMGTTYGPPAGKKMTVFIDDVNMPVINGWGDQVTNEIVRQLLETGGFYSLDKPGDFTHIADMQFIAAMIHPGGGRNDIPQRLKRHFAIFNCTLPSMASMDKIFGVIGLGHYCAERGFTSEVRSTVEKLIPITRKVWQTTKIKMLPTPAKFHYVFNLRDLSRIWQGMINVNNEVIDTPEKLLQLWKHECTRVIADRFINEEDTKWFIKPMKSIITEDMGEEYKDFLEDDHYFVDFLREPPEPTGDEPDDFDFSAPKIYETIPSLDFLKDKLVMYMEQLNETIRGSKMDLVFFQDAMIHVIKISRIIRTPRGNAMLVGVGGSGKQSLTRLASFIAGYKIFQITLTRSYNTNNLMDDLKILYKIAGLQAKGITFIFTDNEIKDDSFLEYMNNILSSGEVSNLFPRDEMDEILQELIPVMKKEMPRHPPTNENLYEYFMNRVRQNLHVVLCFSPIGEKFRNRSLKFPALISGCTMDWFSRWPKDALIAVSTHFLHSFEINCSNKTKEDIQKTMGLYHDGVALKCKEYFQRYRRSTHVTPKSYLSFIQGYKQIYTKRHNEVENQSARMKVGLDKLNEAEKSVVQLSKELVVKEKELEVANAKAQKILEEVTVQAQAAEKVKAEVQKVKDKAQAIVDIITADKEVAEEKLEKAKPALEEAEAALKTITTADIATVRRLGHPPHLIMRIMDCVLILFKRKLDPVQQDPEKPSLKPSWSEAMKMMTEVGFLNNLQQFNKDSINDEIVELMQPYFDAPDYNIETARRVCGNVAGLCSWTTAMANFYAINKEVLPLKANLIVQQARYDSAMVDLKTAQEELDEKEKELHAVQAMYEAAVQEKQELAANAEQCRHKMQTASTLINGLGGEKERWTEQSHEFEKQTKRLVGDVLLATAFLSYSGPFNQEFRSLLSKEWISEMSARSIPFTRQLNLIEMLSDPPTISEWNLQGLPNDELSISNGIIVTNAARYPILIDPQEQGKIWVKKKEGASNIQVTSLDHKYFRTHLENALSLGQPLMIEDVGEELDPALDNVLEKNFMKIGSTYKVKIGDKEVDVMNGFRLFITTKFANPAYSPEIYARTSVIDFTVTVGGLEDQLLGRVILTEKQELEKQRTELLGDVAANKRKMQELEDNLLARLSSTQGSLVDDEGLITMLANTKMTAEDVATKLQIAAETEVQINNAREEYRPVAKRGSILYFLIVEMSLVNVMYQTSLKQFLSVFDKALRTSAKSPITSKRIVNIIEKMTYDVYKYSAQGFYEQDKALFSILTALKIDLASKKIKHEEFNTFIKGGASLDLKSCPPKPCKWILDMTWMNLVELSKLHNFRDILTQIQRNERQWKNWFDKECPEDALIPDGYEDSLRVFHRLLLIRSWCPDRTMAQSRRYIVETLGEQFAEGVLLNLEEMLAESNSRTPLLCFLSMGSDPTNQIESLAKKHKVECGNVSMGQGQEVHARRLLQNAMTQGGWALLQNCHLALDFMNELITTISETEEIHESFRLWITTEVHAHFPIGLLQMSNKFTNDPPQGLKAGLKRSYSTISQDQLEVSNMPQWKPLLYAVAFLHTTVQERRKFGPIGWNIPYEFNQADFNATVQFLQNHLDDMDIKKGVSWNTVRYMIGEIQYGGRVTDDYDKKLLNTFAKVWFSEAMFLSTFVFYKGYSIPHCKTVTQYLDYIKELKSTDTPEVFGLHPNADITYQTKSAKGILDTILSIQPKDSSSGGGETREDYVYRLADDMLSKLPRAYVPFEVKERLKEMGSLKPMNIFLRQEIDRMQKVIHTVRATLLDLKLAIEGTIIMSENLRDALDSMYDARIPKKWLSISWPSSTLGFWFTELLERNAQFYKWCFEGRPNSFWMTGFFNPQGFLTAMKQEVTRAHKGWALDTVRIYNEVTRFMNKEDVALPPQEGVYVYGLYLEGAAWDKRGMKLIESRPKVLFEQIPIILINAVSSSGNKDRGSYICPIYKKPQRTDLNYIADVELKTVQHPDHWILRGVALLCDVK